MPDTRRGGRDRRRVTRNGRRSTDTEARARTVSRREHTTLLLVGQVAGAHAAELDAAGYTTVTTSSADAVVIALHRQPDVIVLDSADGHTGGLHAEFHQTCPHVPVIVVREGARPSHTRGQGTGVPPDCSAASARACDRANLASAIESVRRGSLDSEGATKDR